MNDIQFRKRIREDRPLFGLILDRDGAEFNKERASPTLKLTLIVTADFKKFHVDYQKKKKKKIFSSSVTHLLIKGRAEGRKKSQLVLTK